MYIPAHERRRIERRNTRIIGTALIILILVFGWIGLAAIDEAIDFKMNQDRCWAEEARTGIDRDCKDDIVW